MTKGDRHDEYMRTECFILKNDEKNIRGCAMNIRAVKHSWICKCENQNIKIARYSLNYFYYQSWKSSEQFKCHNNVLFIMRKHAF